MRCVARTMTSLLEQAPNPHGSASGAASHPESCQGCHSVPSSNRTWLLKDLSDHPPNMAARVIPSCCSTPRPHQPSSRLASIPHAPSLPPRSSPVLEPSAPPSPATLRLAEPLPTSIWQRGTTTVPVSAPMPTLTGARGEGMGETRPEGLPGRAAPAPRSCSVRRERRQNRPTAAGRLTAGHSRGPAAQGKRREGTGHCGAPSRPRDPSPGARRPREGPPPHPTPPQSAPRWGGAAPAPPGPSSAQTPPGPGLACPSPPGGPLPSPAAASQPLPAPRLTSAALRTDGRTGGPGQQATRRAGARGAWHRSASARAAAAASRRAPLRSPITQRPGAASRAAARGGREHGTPGRGGDGAGGGGCSGRGAARTRAGASQGCRRLTDPRRSSRSSARGRPRRTPPRARPPLVTSARPDVRD